jgi:hypothetical protein
MFSPRLMCIDMTLLIIVISMLCSLYNYIMSSIIALSQNTIMIMTLESELLRVETVVQRFIGSTCRFVLAEYLI